MGVPARAAVEAPEGERAPKMARSRAADECADCEAANGDVC